MTIPSIPPFTAIVALGLIAGTVAMDWHDASFGKILAHAAALVIAAALEGVRRASSPGSPS